MAISVLTNGPVGDLTDLAGGGAAGDSQIYIWHLKEFLVNTVGWTVPGSSNGTTGGMNGDHITFPSSFNNLVSVAVWIILEPPDSSYQLLINFGGGGNSDRFGIYFNSASDYEGGTTSADPTSPSDSSFRWFFQLPFGSPSGATDVFAYNYDQNNCTLFVTATDSAPYQFFSFIFNTNTMLSDGGLMVTFLQNYEIASGSPNGVLVWAGDNGTSISPRMMNFSSVNSDVPIGIISNRTFTSGSMIHVNSETYSTNATTDEKIPGILALNSRGETNHFASHYTWNAGFSASRNDDTSPTYYGHSDFIYLKAIDAPEMTCINNAEFLIAGELIICWDGVPTIYS